MLRPCVLRPGIPTPPLRTSSAGIEYIKLADADWSRWISCCLIAKALP